MLGLLQSTVRTAVLKVLPVCTVAVLALLVGEHICLFYRAIEADYDEPGLLIMKITKDFAISSYKGKKSLTEKKILHDVFKVC